MQRKQQPQSITSANESVFADQSRRAKVYLIQMAIRVACITGAMFVGGPLRWFLVAMAVILPYVAVVKVNLGRANNRNMDNPMEFQQLEARQEKIHDLEPGTKPTAPSTDSQEP